MKHPLIQAARQLNSPAQRGTHCLLEDGRSLEWALAAGLPIEHVFISDKSLTDFNDLITKYALKTYSVSEGILRKITQTKYLTPIIAVCDHRSLQQRPQQSTVILLDKIQDQGNIGAIIRTAYAFGIHLLASTTPLDLYSKKSITASRGHVFSCHYFAYESTEDALEDLTTKNYRIIATTPKGQTNTTAFQRDERPMAIAIGHEKEGLETLILQKAHDTLRIPMQNDVESLNASVAAGIAIYATCHALTS